MTDDAQKLADRLTRERTEHTISDLQAQLEAQGLDPVRAELAAMKAGPSFRFDDSGKVTTDSPEGTVAGEVALALIAAEIVSQTIVEYDAAGEGRRMAAETKRRADQSKLAFS